MAVFFKNRKDGSKAWYYDFMVNGRRYRCVGGATKTQALRQQDKIRLQVLNGEYDIEDEVGNPRIEKFAKTYLARRQHLKSRDRDALSVRTLLKFFQGRLMNVIDPGLIEDYISYRKASGVANGTVNRELACLKRMYNLAIRWKEARKNPVDGVEFLREPPGRTRYLKSDEIESLLQVCSPHLKPVVLTALHTGIRRREILGLRWKDVHMQAALDPYIEVTQTKNNKNRVVPLDDDMIELLESLRSKHPEFVFVGKFGRPLQSIKRPFETALRAAGIHDFRFHDLRHTFASYFVMSGGDLLTLKEILGHSSMKMVERYTHLATAYKRRQINNLSETYKNCHLFATSADRPDFQQAVSLVKTNSRP